MLGLMVAIIALVLAVIVYVREKKHAHQADCCCKAVKRCLCKLTSRVAADEKNANSLIGEYSFGGTITGTTAATSLSILDGVGAPNNVVSTPFAGTVAAISFAVSSIPTSGSISGFITKNGIATTLSVTIDSTATSTYATALGSVPFLVADLIGISFTTDAVVFPSNPTTLTAQAFVNYTA